METQVESYRAPSVILSLSIDDLFHGQLVANRDVERRRVANLTPPQVALGPESDDLISGKTSQFVHSVNHMLRSVRLLGILSFGGERCQEVGILNLGRDGCQEVVRPAITRRRNASQRHATGQSYGDHRGTKTKNNFSHV